MSDLNSDWVLYAAALTVIIAVIAFIGFGFKAAKGMNGIND